MAVSTMLLWFTNLTTALLHTTDNVLIKLLFLWIQSLLFIGLFVNAHDCIHGLISRSKKINTMIGTISCFLFAGFNYNFLKEDHIEHHKYPAQTKKDPDYTRYNHDFFLDGFIAL